MKRTGVGIVAVALGTLAIWPAFASSASSATVAAPLRDDVAIRAATIAFEEGRLGRDAADQITPRMLSDEYLQRYRERGDIGDVVRAKAMAQRSLARAPLGNPAAQLALAAAQSTLHQFEEARETVRSAGVKPDEQTQLGAFEASLDLEIGDRSAAESLIRRHLADASWAVVRARHAELTGDLATARSSMRLAAVRADQTYGLPNERRAWFHVRLGELAFAGGDVASALAEEHVALDRYADDVQAETDIARFAAASGDWNLAREAAGRASALIPSPENLGLLADAQERCGERTGASATRDEIEAIGRLADTQHVNDRLIAMYDADHGIHVDEAFAIATRDLTRRHDPLAHDAVAWTAARAGRWDIAAAAARRAIDWNPADARVWYHAAYIADHQGDRRTAVTRYAHALSLNPHFQAGVADDARARLNALLAR